MNLTPRQQQVKDSMVAGTTYTIYQLHTNTMTMDILRRARVVERVDVIDIGGHRVWEGNICNGHSYKLIN